MVEKKPKIPAEQAKLILKEQLDLLNAALPLGVLATIINAVLLSFFQWKVIEHAVVISWFVYILMVSSFRLWLTFQYKKQAGNDIDEVKWLKLFQIGVFLAGSGWGAAAVLLFPVDNIAHQVFLAFVIAGMSAGGVSSLSYIQSQIRIFALLACIPLILKLLSVATTMSLAMSFMVLMFLVTVLLGSSRIYRSTLDNIRLRLQAAQRETALSESETRFRMIFDTAPLGIVQYDHQGNIVAANAELTSLLGIENHALLGLNLVNYCSGMFADCIKQTLNGEPAYFSGMTNEIAGQRAVHVRVYLRSFISDSGEVAGGVAIFEDITEDKRIEKLKDEFVSTVSHELRTPMTSIEGALGLIKGLNGAGLSSEALSLLDIAYRNSSRLLLLINDILDLNKIESGKMEFNEAPVELEPLVRNAVEVNAIYGASRGVSFDLIEAEPGMMVHVDKHRLLQVISNLLSNAAKFSHENSKVGVYVVRQNKHACIKVQDHGVGIPEEFQSKIFSRFSQSDSSDTRNVGGTGLGLYISKALIEQMHGTIGFESTPGKGTIFTIQLPLESEG